MEPLLFTLLLGLGLGHLAFLLFHTDFVVEYGVRLGLRRLLKTEEYEKWKEASGLDYGYPIFLRETYPNFFGKLIGCPFCFMTLASVLFSLGFGLWFLLIGLAAAAIGSLTFLMEKLLYKKNFEQN